MGFDSMSAGIAVCCDTTGPATPVTVQTNTITATMRAMTPAVPTTIASFSRRSGDGEADGAMAGIGSVKSITMRGSPDPAGFRRKGLTTGVRHTFTDEAPD